MNLYGPRQLADSLRTVRKNTILIAEDIPEKDYGYQPFQLSFNRFLRADFQGSRVASDGGLILVRELDEQFALSELIGDHLVDSRTGRSTQFPRADLLRQSVDSWLGGYEDLNDAANWKGK